MIWEEKISEIGSKRTYSSLIRFFNSSSFSASFFTLRTLRLPFSSSEQLFVLDSSFRMVSLSAMSTLRIRTSTLSITNAAVAAEGLKSAACSQVCFRYLPTWYENGTKRSEKVEFPLLLVNPQTGWKHGFCTGFCTGKHVPCTGKHAPCTGGMWWHVQNTCFAHVLHVFCTCFRIRVMIVYNCFEPWLSMTKKSTYIATLLTPQTQLHLVVPFSI